MITLTLTDDEAEILGFALNRTARNQRDTADNARPGSDHKSGCRSRQLRLEALANKLDIAPAT